MSDVLIPTVKDGQQDRRVWHAFLILMVSFAIYVAPGRNGGTADTIPAQLLPISLLREGNLDFNEFVCPVDAVTGKPVAYAPGPCASTLPYYFRAIGGRVVSLYPIIPGLLNVPVHVVAALFGVDTIAARGQLSLVTAGLVTALAVAWLFLLLGELRFAESTRWIGAFTFALGTAAWSVTGRGLWQHGPSLLFLIGALWCIARKTPTALGWAGFLLGLAIFNRPANVLLVLPLAWHVIGSHPKGRWRFVLAGTVPVGLMLVYSSTVFASVFAMGQGQRMRIGGTPLEGLAGVLFSPARGLFVFSPILLLGLLALPGVFRRNSGIELMRPLILGTAGVIVLHGTWAVWWGGHSFGYRLLSETLPCLIILLAVAWEEHVRSRRMLVVLAGVLLAVSVAANALGALVAPCGFDTQPDFIDYHPDRLWTIADTELIRCVQQAFGEPRR